MHGKIYFTKYTLCIEANHIFPFFVPQRSFMFDQIRSWLRIFSFVYIPPYQAALLDLFENKYTFSQGSTPDFIGNLNFQNSSQNSFFVMNHIYNGCCTAPEILSFHSYCSGCTQEGLLFSLTDSRLVRMLVQGNKSLKYFALVAIFTSCSNRQNTIFHVIHLHFHIAEV